ncbi:deoxyribodipyrimidine photo-lyase [uncultured Pseudokineococcus sp.]|uniref:cryptochrome/photolyase family protein n=1 Tax=uncultured Pseudokineococcus sp. TaxID=1642928 RepID=UPI002635F254|nr:deoxyribodipyrimidine photo-lyase [uncultured Pseudokineococcus sp.]
MSAAVLWFRRDLRLGDNPALLAALERGGDDGVVPLFVLDPRVWEPSGDPRRRFLVGCLQALREATGGALLVRRGDPRDVVPAVVREAGAGSVHVARDVGPYGRRRDAAVREALAALAGDDGAGVPLVEDGTSYAVGPGRVVKSDGTPFQVFTPFSRAWRAHGVPGPAPTPGAVPWARLDGPDELPDAPPVDADLLEPGEDAARAAWRSFRDERLDHYADERDRPDLDSTSRMSAYLHLGCVHPRTLVAEAGARGGAGAEAYVRELCFRDFYADVLWHRPDSAREAYKPDLVDMEHDDGDVARERVRAWEQGRTGYPIIDAAMRQLLGQGWMHNRMRMLVASFYVKDLHQRWQPGARFFLQHLVDGDLASNNHGWQWVAGSGTDASPYFRVFNPVLQGRKFDPRGDYVRRWVPELRGVEGAAVHEPWALPGGVPDGYPERVVDHAAERQVALDRYQAVRGG